MEQTASITSEVAAETRGMWHLLENIHAIVYFAPEVVDAAKRIGLKGFWMGYFAGRAAPFGTASDALVAATFFNFCESMVGRALPDAWAMATPDQILEARLEAIDATLRRVLDAEVLSSPELRQAADLAEEATGGCSVGGRPLFAATTTVPWPGPPHLRLWHAATLVREHRGDGHIAANVAAGFDGLDSLVMACGTGAVPRARLQGARGWTDDEWDGATARLVERGLFDGGGLTDLGRAERRAVELTTDALALEPWTHLGAGGTRRLRQLLEPLVAAVVSAGVVSFPNPIGLPPSQGTTQA